MRFHSRTASVRPLARRLAAFVVIRRPGIDDPSAVFRRSDGGPRDAARRTPRAGWCAGPDGRRTWPPSAGKWTSVPSGGPGRRPRPPRSAESSPPRRRSPAAVGIDPMHLDAPCRLLFSARRRVGTARRWRRCVRTAGRIAGPPDGGGGRDRAGAAAGVCVRCVASGPIERASMTRPSGPSKPLPCTVSGAPAASVDARRSASGGGRRMIVPSSSNAPFRSPRGPCRCALMRPVALSICVRIARAWAADLRPYRSPWRRSRRS